MSAVAKSAPLRLSSRSQGSAAAGGNEHATIDGDLCCQSILLCICAESIGRRSNTYGGVKYDIIEGHAITMIGHIRVL